MAKIKLCFDALPFFVSSPLLCSLEPDTERVLRALPNVYERSIAALRFLQMMPQEGIFTRVSDDHVPIMQVAYLRAALMDYIGMEEMLPTDLAGRGLGLKQA